jgi:hypothetical protein
MFSRVAKSGNTSTLLYLRDAEKFVGGRGLLGIESLTCDVYRSRETWNRFAVVRNPFDRLLSGYLDKSKKPAYRDLPGMASRDPEGFRIFVDFLAKKRIIRNHHFRSQYGLLAWSPEKFDSIIKLENFEGGFSLLMEKAGVEPSVFGGFRRAHPEYQKSKGLVEGGRRTTQLRADFYDEASVASAVTLYRKDFHSFGYRVELDFLNSRSGVAVLQFA